MKIIPIFEAHNQSLWSVQEENSEFDEFERIFSLWQDTEYLFEFFETNKDDLDYHKLSVEEAVMQTLHYAKELQKQILDIYDSEEDVLPLNSHFQPLDNITYKQGELEECKAYMTTYRKGWLRLYAVKVPEENYVFTGGAIKLTPRMSDRPHTLLERQKLKNCFDYLRSQGICDEDGLSEL